jgi:hypothetical protein
LLQAVERAPVADEHVNHEVDVVHQNPLGPQPSFDVGRLHPVASEEPFLDGVCDGQNLSVRRAVTDYEVIGNVAQAVEIKDDDVLRFSVAGRVDTVGKLGSQGRFPPSE